MNISILPNKSYIQNILDNAVEDKLCAGASVLIMHGGREMGFFKAGYADLKSGRKIERDTIFRIYSQSKPVTGFASVMCMERGLLGARQFARDYMDAFAEPYYWSDGVLKKVPIPVTIGMFLNMTAAVPYPGNPADTTSAYGAAARTHAEAAGVEKKGSKLGTVELMDKIVRGGLSSIPGTRWEYGHSADVMGAIIELASGKRFGQFLKEEIFEPLGMVDTGFILPQSKRQRLATTYKKIDGELTPFGYADYHLGLRGYAEDTVFESGGAGLVSTLDDYAAFLRMLRADGLYAGHRLVTKSAAQYFHQPQLLPSQMSIFNWDDFQGQNYGNYLWIRTSRGMGSTFDGMGTYSWGGWLGTNFFVDPQNDVQMLFMVQHCDTYDRSLYHRLRNATYAFLEL